MIGWPFQKMSSTHLKAPWCTSMMSFSATRVRLTSMRWEHHTKMRLRSMTCSSFPRLCPRCRSDSLKNQVPGNAQMQIVILKDLDGYTCSKVAPAPPENAQLRWQSHQKVRLTHLWMAQRLGRQGSPQFGDGALARKEFHYSHFNPDMWKEYGISIQNI